MIELTEIAAKKILEIAEKEGIIDPLLRIGLRGGGCSGFVPDLYYEDKPLAETDQTFEVRGVKIVIDQMSAMYLMGIEVDYVDGLMGTEFKFNGSQISGKCGCGASVSFK